MLFTVSEMELICVFYSGTLSETLEILRRAAQEIALPAKKTAALSAVKKLEAMKPGDPVSLIFESH